MKCKAPKLAPSTSYVREGCRCTRCRKWQRQNKKERMAVNGERLNRQHREWVKKNRGKARAWVVAWKKRHKQRTKELNRGSYLRRKFGIDLPEYRRLHKNQGGLCAVCSKKDNSDRRLAVDHCHKTGKVRGLLCGKCNKGLGLFGDTSEILKDALRYLLSAEAKNKE